jgi:hypothetical protein
VKGKIAGHEVTMDNFLGYGQDDYYGDGSGGFNFGHNQNRSVDLHLESMLGPKRGDQQIHLQGNMDDTVVS